MSEQESSRYDIASIQVLEGGAAVRKRPGMYVGTGATGMVQLVFELVSHVVGQHAAGHAHTLSIATGPAGITVADDGLGLPAEQFPALVDLFGPERFDPTVRIARHGIGYGVINALSSVLVFTSDRERRHQQVFVRGEAVTPVLDAGPAHGRGNTVHLVPDTSIFGDARLPLAVLRERLETLAILNPELRITLDGAEIPSYGGLLGRARALAGSVRDTLATRGTFDGVDVELAVVWGDGEPLVWGWVNQLECQGAHIDGLLEGLEGTREHGRVALLSVGLADPIYRGQTRREVEGDGLRAIVRDVVRLTRTSPG